MTARGQRKRRAWCLEVWKCGGRRPWRLWACSKGDPRLILDLILAVPWRAGALVKLGWSLRKAADPCTPGRRLQREGGRADGSAVGAVWKSPSWAFSPLCFRFAMVVG